MIEPIVKGLPVADVAFIKALREMDEEILNLLYNHSNDLIQKILVEEICTLKGFSLETKLTA